MSDLPLTDQILGLMSDGGIRSAAQIAADLGLGKTRDDLQPVYSAVYTLRLQGRLTIDPAGIPGAATRTYRLPVDPLPDPAPAATQDPSPTPAPPPAAPVQTPPKPRPAARRAVKPPQRGPIPTPADLTLGLPQANAKLTPDQRTKAVRLNLMSALLGHVQALIVFLEQGHFEAAEATLAAQIDTLSALYLVEKKDP